MLALTQGMMSLGAGGGGGGSDPDFASVVSLLHFDGADGSTTFTDQKGKTWTSSHAANARLSTTNPRFGSACLLLSGSTISTPDSDDWHFGANDFTIEFFMRPQAVPPTGAPLAQWDGGTSRGWIIFTFSNSIWFSYSTTGANQIDVQSTSAVTYSASSYVHIAVSCNGGTIRLYADGALVGSAARAGALFNSPNPLRIGNEQSGTAQYNGRIDDLRITKGVGRYPAAFTPPTAPFPDS